MAGSSDCVDIDCYTESLDKARQEQRLSGSIPKYYSQAVSNLMPSHVQSLRPLAILPSNLSFSNDSLWIPPRTFYGFPLPLSDAVRFLEKYGFMEPISEARGISVQRKAEAASLLPKLADNYIQDLFRDFDMHGEQVQPTFFADVIGGDGMVVTLFAIGDSWNPISTPPPVIAGVAYFLEKQNELPYFYLAAHEDGLWRQSGDLEKRRQVRSGRITTVLDELVLTSDMSQVPGFKL